MDENNFTFDPSLKKKKKKKKQLVSLEEQADLQQTSTTDAVPEKAGAAAVQQQEDEKQQQQQQEKQEEDTAAAVPEEKPEKKRKLLDVMIKPSDLKDIDGSSYISILGTGDIPWKKLKKNKTDDTELESEMGSLSFNLARKKKKKNQKKLTLKDVGTAEDDKDQGKVQHSYEDLLENAFTIMRAKNPELAGGEKKSFVISPPNVVRLGSKKTGFANFVDIAKQLHRDPNHMCTFLTAELGTSASTDSADCLVIRGRFQPRQIESVVRTYIRQYVTCHTCKSPDTMLAKQNRLYFLQCEACGSRRTVSNIKAGFTAQTGKRSAMRAKAQ